MGEDTGNHTEENYHILDTQEISLSDFQASGWILDIGGGGEGIIGQLKGNQVIAIDPNRRELEEAAEGPIKIIMNAKDLQFLDNSFEVVTSFYTLMYIKRAEHLMVFKEVYRVLNSGGRFLIWDLSIPQRSDEKEDLAVVIIKAILPDREIETGYGTHWPEKPIDFLYFQNLAEGVGFHTVNLEEKGKTFYLELIKP